MKGSRARREGFTLVEVTVSVSILAIITLVIASAVMSTERLNNIARERTVANAAIRSYIEAARQYYPDQNSTDMSGYLADAKTPVDYLPAAGTVENRVLNNVEAYITKITHENPAVGAVPVVGAAPAAGGGGVGCAAVYPAGSTPPAIAQDDINAFDMPRDLNANNQIDASQPIDPTKIFLIPVRIEIRWLSGSSTQVNSTTGKQKIIVYAIFSPQH